MKLLFPLSLFLLSASPVGMAADSPSSPPPGWREEFCNQTEENGISVPADWILKTKWGTPTATFRLVDSPEL